MKRSHSMSSTPATRPRQGAKFLVLVERTDGASRLFQAYDTRGEAEAVASRLRDVGCPCRVDLDSP